MLPYLITLLLCGIPVLFMELAIGQFTGRGPIKTIGQLCPLLKGDFFLIYCHSEKFKFLIAHSSAIKYICFRVNSMQIFIAFSV